MHVRVTVDNAALPPMIRKGRSKRQQETDMVREIVLLQAQHGWSWAVEWRPREQNEAADALSKNDMPRFWSNVTGSRQEIAIRKQDLQLPEVGGDSKGLKSTMVAKAWGAAHRPHRRVLRELSTEVLHGPALWDMLGGQVQHLKNQMKGSGTTTGVRHYLRLALSAGRSLDDMFPEDEYKMVANLQRFLLDCVLSYPYWDETTGR